VGKGFLAGGALLRVEHEQLGQQIDRQFVCPWEEFIELLRGSLLALLCKVTPLLAGDCAQLLLVRSPDKVEDDFQLVAS